MNIRNNNYPATWALARLGDFVESDKGKKPRRESKIQQGTFRVPYIDIEAFETGVIKSWTDGNQCRLCSETDFLMVWDGSRSGLVGKGLKGALGSTLIRLNFPCIYNLYAFYFLKSKFLEINTRTKGSGTPHVNPELLWNYTFPIAPTEEQIRIVTKIEELFSELNNGIENLITARAQLKVYRHAVLKHAFEGKLTEHWRKKNQTVLETGDQLLSRIKEERTAKFSRLIDAWNKTNSRRKRHRKPRSPGFAEHFSIAEREKLGSLPNNWVWSKIGDLFGVFVGATPSRKNHRYWGDAVNWVSSGEVRFNRIKSTRESISINGLNNTSTEIHPVGTVMLAMIGEGKTRGQAAILEIPACHNQNTAAIRVSETDCAPQFLYYYLFFQYEITRTLGSGNNQKALNKERVSNMSFPLAPIAEQKELVAIIENRMSVVDQMEQEIDLEIQKAEALRQSILKNAFSGKLVAQDPTDEAVSILLDRIEATKAEKGNRKKKFGRRKAA